ncbi:MAG: bifunctional nuclease family protein [Halobacteriota archaeon]
MKAHIDAVRLAPTPDGAVPVVVLGVEDDPDVLPIFIGFTEADAIARGLEAEDIGRPLTHDLLLDVVEELGGRIAAVEIVDIRDDTYIADISLDTPRGTTTIDARPSDSLALAARTNAPIEIEPTVFDRGRRDHEEFAALTPLREAVEYR